MGKRSQFARVERDFYPTPRAAVLPLLPHLTADDCHYIEPCAGDGALAAHLADLANLPCLACYDIAPQADWIVQSDALARDFPHGQTFITNPPWNRKILHQLIERLSDRGPTWLLFDADWVHTKQAIPYLPRLRKIVSVGRVKWFADSKSTGKDNCCWHLFDKPGNGLIEFAGRSSNV